LEQSQLTKLKSKTQQILKQSHAFFKSIDWDKLLKKEIPTPFQPKVKNALDTSFFDEEFTRENVKDELEQASVGRETVLNTVEQKAFEGFTFTGDKELGTKEEEE
jgi:hypothetical protein